MPLDIARLRQEIQLEILWRGKPFTGASGQRKADKFETEGVNIRARKPTPVRGDRP